MNSLNVGIYLIVILISNTIETITGFAGTLLAMPPSMILIGINEAKVALNFLSLLTCTFITIKNYKSINKEEFINMFLFMTVGMLVGIKVFDRLEANMILKAYSLLLVSVGLSSLSGKSGKKKLSPTLSIIILISAGFIHGMFVSGGSLLVIYAANKLKNKSEFRATLAPLWMGLNSILLYEQASTGLINLQIVKLIAISILPMILGIFFGEKLHHKINQAFFLKITYVLVTISGLMLLFQ